MAAPVMVKSFEVKPFAKPDELRTPAKARVEVIHLGGFTLGRFNLEPGWRWSECIKPVVKTDSCQVAHVGYVVSGRLTIRQADGTQKTVSGGDAYSVPPGHDAWVEGQEPVVALEVLSAEQYAKA
jgi:hypothetical protein